jgi:diguanylate cyclase (GGDEF)-like protein/PAS domain S-box-containing protein
MIKIFQDQLAAICPDPIIAIDRAGIIVLFNQAAEQLLEYRASEVVGKVSIAGLYHPHHAGHTVKRLMHSQETGTYGRIQGHESAIKSKSGRVIPIQISATLIMEAGQEVGSVGFFHDLTARKELEQSLRLLSITDNLSGLYNQRHFYATLSQEIARSRRYGHPLSLICIDMDKFKTVNDTLGHQEGDNLITHLGSLIRNELRSADFGFRYGGDEFMLILPQTDQKKAAIVAERLRKAFYDTASTTLQPRPQSLPCLTLSIGIVLYIDGDPEEQFIRSGDMAMYQAKESGGNRVVMAQPADQPHH